MLKALLVLYMMGLPFTLAGHGFVPKAFVLPIAGVVMIVLWCRAVGGNDRY